MASNDIEKLPSSKTLAKAIAIFGGAQAFSVLAALIRSKVAAVTIGTVGVGLNALYVTLSNLMATLFSFGLSSSSVPALCQLQGEEQRQLVARLRLLGCLLSVLSVPVTLVVASFYSVQTLWLALPVVALILSGIETAVMKSLQATRQLTKSLMSAALFSVVLTVPFFVWLGLDGVIWAVVSTVTVSSIYSCWIGYHVCPVMPDFSLLDRTLWGKVRPMFVLGFAFLISGLLAQGVDLLNQMWLESVASLALVGLFKAGYQLSVTYTRMVFSAIANDFFPRLSSVVRDTEARNRLITQQVRVLLFIVVPMILVFELVVPWVVPLLFSHEFLPIVTMVRVAALSVIFRAVSLPIGYLPVALERSWHFLLLEALSWVVRAIGVIGGYSLGGLLGIGYGILMSDIADMCFVWIFCRIKYSFRLCFKD